MKKRLFITLLLVVFCAGTAFAGSQGTSSSTAATLITKVRYLLNESAASFWADAELASYLNEAVYDVVGRTRCMETTETESLITSTAEYALATSYIDITGVLYQYLTGTTYVKGLIRGDIASIGHVEDVGEPVYFYEWNDTVGVYPLPTSSVTGHQIVVYMIERPNGVTATTSPIETPAVYDRALILYAGAQAFYKDGKWAKGTRLMAEYMEELDRFRVDFTDRRKMPKESVK